MAFRSVSLNNILFLCASLDSKFWWGKNCANCWLYLKYQVCCVIQLYHMQSAHCLLSQKFTHLTGVELSDFLPVIESSITWFECILLHHSDENVLLLLLWQSNKTSLTLKQWTCVSFQSVIFCVCLMLDWCNNFCVVMQKTLLVQHY